MYCKDSTGLVLIQRSRSVLQIRVIRGDSGNTGQRNLPLDDFIWNYSTQMQMSVMSDPSALWRLCEFHQKTIKTCRQQKSGLDIHRPARHITKTPADFRRGRSSIYMSFYASVFFVSSAGASALGASAAGASVLGAAGFLAGAFFLRKLRIAPVGHSFAHIPQFLHLS